MRETPPAALRRRRATALLELLVFAVLSTSAAVHLPGSAGEAAGTPVPPPPPLAVDVESDPPARLELLPGIGPVRAEAIAAERLARGPFGSVDGLARVRGIGPVTVRRIRSAREVRPRFRDR